MSNRWVKSLSLFTVTSMLGVMLSACGDAATPGTGGTGTGTGAATTVPATAATGGGTAATPAGGSSTDATPAGGGTAGGGMPSGCSAVELQYWNPFTGPDGPFMGQLTDKFNASQKDVKVTMTSQAEYYPKLGTAAASDQLPDVAIVHADQLATMAFRNIIRPMDDLVGTMGIAEADYPAAVWAPGNIEGHRYSIPLDIHPMTMFYNADLLKKAGMETAPQTRADFEKAAAAMTSGGNQGFNLTSGFPAGQIFQMLINQFGGSVFNEAGTEVAFNSEAGVKALQWMKDAQSKYSAPKLEVDAELASFKTGNTGMIWNGIWQTTSVTGSGVDFAGKATSVPQIGDKMAVWAGSHQLTLPKHGNVDKCKDAGAAMFIKFVAANSVEWAKAGQIPASTKVRNSAEFKALDPQASIAPSVEHAFFPPAGVPGITDANGAPIDEAVGAIMSGTATDIKDTLNKAAGRANEILKQNKANFGDKINPNATPVPPATKAP